MEDTSVQTYKFRNKENNVRHRRKMKTIVNVKAQTQSNLSNFS